MQSFPFDSYVTYDSQGNPTYDRAVSSQPLRTIIRKLFTTGVMPNPSTNFQVNAGTDGMTVLVQPGFAVVDGGLCKEDEVRTLSVTAADAIYDRIDTVVLRWNENVDVRTADLYVLAGTPAETPVRPALQRNDSIYEIGLADVFITHGLATITGDKITDTRYESERCGIVSSVSEWDTTTIYQQIQSELAKFKSVEEVAFTNWFESIKDQFDEDVAGHLQNEIDKNTKDISDVNGRLTQVQSQIVPTASIESGETASKAYSKGDFLVKDGILYKVTNAIAKGGALTVGTNIAMTTVGSELSSISEPLSDDIDRVTQDGVVLTSPYTCTRKRECIRVEVGPGSNDSSGGQIFVNGHLVVKANSFSASAGSGFSVQTLIYLYEGDVLTFNTIKNGRANAWRVSDD